MLACVRAGIVAALLALSSLALVSLTANAADKPFVRDDLADMAIKLEAQIKSEAGQATKQVGVLRRDADAAFQRNDLRSGMQILGQLVTAAPNDGAAWLRLARAILQIRGADDRERTVLLERASTAAYIAYQRSTNRNEEADSLTVLGRALSDRKIWRPALDALRIALDLREAADVRTQYERLRAEHGFRLLDYTVDSDAASPRACFQFSEGLPGKRTDFSPFVAVGGQDKPALSIDEKQLCVEGLKHGERYAVTLRAGLPSTVRETLAKSAEYTIYVRDRRPFVRFTGKAYVLPRAGQRGIPVVSVNTRSVAVEIYRIGDRNLIDAVFGRDFQRNLSRYNVNRLDDQRGQKVWNGALAASRPSMPRSRPPFRSIRRSAISPPASTSWWPNLRAQNPRTTRSSRPNGSSSPISALRPSPAMTESTCSSTRWRARSRADRSRCGSCPATTRSLPPAPRTAMAGCNSSPG